MREVGTFELHLQPATTASPTRFAVVFTGDQQGLMQLTPECDPAKLKGGLGRAGFGAPSRAADSDSPLSPSLTLQ